MISKLKYKYSLKPKWLDRLKKVISKQDIPMINTSLKQIHKGDNIPIVLRRNPNNLKLNNLTLDEYLVDDIIGDHDLNSTVPLLSSDGDLNYQIDSD